MLILKDLFHDIMHDSLNYYAYNYMPYKPAYKMFKNHQQFV